MSRPLASTADTIAVFTEAGLPVTTFTTAERDALEDIEAGTLVWNSDRRELQVYRDHWEAVVIDPVLMAFFSFLSLRIAQVTTALRWLGIDVSDIQPDDIEEG